MARDCTIRHSVWPIVALQRQMRFSARLAGFCRGRWHQRRARRAEQASFSDLVSNRDFRVPRLRQRGERDADGAGRRRKRGRPKDPESRPGLPWRSGLARSGPVAPAPPVVLPRRTARVPRSLLGVSVSNPGFRGERLRRRKRWRQETAEHGRSKPRNQCWIDLLQSTGQAAVSLNAGKPHRCNPPTGVSKMLDFLRFERPVEDRALTVGEPFLENLVAAQFVAPDGSRDVAPEGLGIERRCCTALAESEIRLWWWPRYVRA